MTTPPGAKGLLALEAFGVGVTVLFALFALWIALFAHTLTLAQTVGLEKVACVISCVLWLASGLICALSFRDWRQSIGSAHVVAFRLLCAAAYRFVAKGLLALFFILLYAASNRDVALFLTRHPWTGASIVLSVLVIFSINDLIEPLWRSWFRDVFGKDDA